MLTDLQLFLIAFPIAVIGALCVEPLARKAGIPEYGSPNHASPGWTLIYCLVLWPAAVATALLIFMFVMYVGAN